MTPLWLAKEDKTKKLGKNKREKRKNEGEVERILNERKKKVRKTQKQERRK